MAVERTGVSSGGGLGDCGLGGNAYGIMKLKKQTECKRYAELTNGWIGVIRGLIVAGVP
jgi:hypothetical protein